MFQRQRSKNQNSHRFLHLAALLLLVTAVGGCSEPAKPKAPAASGAVQKPVLATAPTPTQQVVTAAAPVYTYNPAGRRDPFAPIIVREDKRTKSGDRPPLERYSVTDFKLSGIIWGGFGYNAMLEGPDGKGYFVRVGTVLGPNRGVIKKITKNNLVVEEKYKTYTGDMQTKEIVVELRKNQEATP